MTALGETRPRKKAGTTAVGTSRKEERSEKEGGREKGKLDSNVREEMRATCCARYTPYRRHARKREGL